jgi:hypothetical protein
MVIECLKVNYVNDSDLFLEYRNIPVCDINIKMLKDRDLILKSLLLIFKRGFDYKVLKSKY